MSEPMTVRDLHAALDDLMRTRPDTADMKIATEGCDCYGDVGSLAVVEPSVWAHDGIVELYRTSQED